MINNTNTNKKCRNVREKLVLEMERPFHFVNPDDSESVELVERCGFVIGHHFHVLMVIGGIGFVVGNPVDFGMNSSNEVVEPMRIDQ